MALLVPNVGEVEMLKRLLNFSAATDSKLKLYSNNATPAETDTTAAYTEVSGFSYTTGGQTLVGASWTIITDGTGTTAATYSELSFQFGSGLCTVYGYFVTNSTGVTLLWSERFTDGPYVIPAGGGTIRITPKIELA